MSRKLGKASPEEQLRILNQLDEEKNPRLIGIDDYDRYTSFNNRFRIEIFDLLIFSELKIIAKL